MRLPVPPRRRGGARLLRCDTLWGACDWSEALPALRHAPEALYRPRGPEGPWGVFADGRPLGDHGGLPADGPMPEPESVEEGPFLYIGHVATHYGHFLVNTLPHLWPLLSWSGPRPRLLTHAAPGSRASWDATWAGLGVLAESLSAFGYTVGDLVAFDRPVRLTDVHVPEPALHEQASVHAIYGALCRHIGRPHWREADSDTSAQPLYLSKTRLPWGIARIVNEDAIVAALDRRGVAIVHPETLTFAAQVALLSRHPIVMGSVGSAFHTAAFAAPGRRLVGLNWQRPLNANFALIDRAAGASARYYHPHGTRYEEPGEWQVRWRVADPEGVADALIERADWLDRGEPDDDGVRAALRRQVGRLLRR